MAVLACGALGSIARAQEPGAAGWFIPRYSALARYRDADLTQPAGTLPDSPSAFAIVEAKGKAYGLSAEARPERSEFFVRQSEGYIAPRHAQLSFRSPARLAVRPSLRFWLNRSTLEDHLNKDVTVENQADLDEMEGIKATFAKTFPVLAEATINSGNAGKVVRIAQVLLRIPPLQLGAESPQLSNDRRQLLLLIDDSGSMAPLGQQVVGEFLNRLAALDPDWKARVSVATLAFKGGPAPAGSAQPQPFRTIDQVAASLSRTLTFTGGGEDEEPFLDALYMGARQVPWAARATTKRITRVIVAFTSVDILARTSGQMPYAAADNLGTDQVLAELRRNDIALLVLQATPEPGETLLDLLEKVKSDGTATGGLAYGSDLAAVAVQRLKDILAIEQEQELQQRRNRAIAEKTAELSGIALFPCCNGYDRIAKVAAVGKLPDVTWVHIPLWLVHDDNIVSIR